MSACERPAAWEDLVAYFAGDLDAAGGAALEEHLFACRACAAQAARVASVTETLRAMIPPVVTRAEIARLRSKGMRVRDSAFGPGERRGAHFPRDLDLLVFHLTGLDLPQGARVGMTMHDEASGQRLVSMDDVPYDAGSGELLLCCQRHYAALPPDVVVDVKVEAPGADRRETRYTIQHTFE